MPLFPTHRKENLQSRLRRWQFNLFPAYWHSGGRVVFIAEDWQEAHVRLGLTWRTRNYVGTVFGGSIYAAVDPIYMLQLIYILGKDYVVWDKAATVKFIRPIKKTVKAKFLIEKELIEDIRRQVDIRGEHTIDLIVRFEDETGAVYAEIGKTLYIADQAFYKEKQAKKARQKKL